MGCPTTDAQRPPPGAAFAGASPRAPRKLAPYPLPTKLDIRLSDDLRKALRRRAQTEGATDSAMARRLLCDALAVESPVDVASPPVPPEELQTAARMLDRLTALVLASRTLSDGQAGGAIAAMESAHGQLVAIIARMER